MFNRSYDLIMIFIVIFGVGILSTDCEIDIEELPATRDSPPPSSMGTAETAVSENSFLISEDSIPSSFIMNSYAEFIGSNAPSSILGLAGGPEFRGEEQLKEETLPPKWRAVHRP